MSTGINTPRRLEFSAEARQIWGDAIAELEELDALFSPYSFEQFQREPQRMRDIYAEAQPRIDKCKVALRKFFMENIFGRENPDIHRSPKKDGIEEFRGALKSLTDVYPAYARSDVPFVQALYLNLIFYDVVSELFARFTHHPTNKHVERALTCFRLAEQTTGKNNRTSYLLTELPSTREFFMKHPILAHTLEHLSLAELQKINIEIFAGINRNRQYEVPLSVSREEDMSRTPLILLSDQPQSATAQFGKYDADFGLYDARFERVLTDRGTLDGMRTQGVSATMDGTRVIIHGESVQILIDRFTGDLNTTMLSAEALKSLIGEKTYEALRAYILLRYAQLVCDDQTFVREFRDFVTLVDPPAPIPPHRQGGSSAMPPPPPLSENPPWQGKLPLRFFPRAARRYLRTDDTAPATAEHQQRTGRHLRGRRSEAHRRLLPSDWKPTEQSREKAREEGADLLSSFEVVYEILDREFRFMDQNLQARFDIGEFIFTRDDFIQEAAARGISFDTLLSSITQNQVRERQFTYVAGHEFGDVPTAVRARFRYDLRAAATPPANSSNPPAVEAAASAGTNPDR